MSLWSETLAMLKKMGMSRGAIQQVYGKTRRIGRGVNGARTFPKGFRAKRKRLQKIQKESRRRNRA